MHKRRVEILRSPVADLTYEISGNFHGRCPMKIESSGSTRTIKIMAAIDQARNALVLDLKKPLKQ
jgi:hypothetical protein